MNNKNKEAILSELWQIEKQLVRIAVRAQEENGLETQGKALSKLDGRLINIISEIEEVTYD